ncbi:MAG: T9SS type A sorting domain-containing protein [Bacteroidota bacterium]
MINKTIIFLFVIFGCVCLSPAQTNIGFEQTVPGVYTASNAVSGWTLESTTTSLNAVICNTNITWSPGSVEFSVMITPILANPYTLANPFSIDNISIMNSPLGGNNVVRLQDATGTALATRLRTTFPVTTANSTFYFAYAGSWDGSAHQCCDQPSFHVKIYSCAGLADACRSTSVIPLGSSCIGGVNNYSFTNSISWTNWQTNTVDLSAYIGSCVTIEVTNSDCTGNSHHGSVYFDAKTGTSYPLTAPSVPIFTCLPLPPVNLCSNSSFATIVAPAGYFYYQWYAPGNPPVAVPGFLGGNSSILTVTNALVGSIYTVQMVSPAGCSVTIQNTIQFSTVSIAGVGSSSTNCGNANGSATVIAGGSGTGYNYAWYAAGNSNPVGTGSVISNLAAGVYTVGVSAFNSVGCGSAVATVTVGVNNVSTSIQYFCPNEANLSAPINASNIQWYNGLSAISAGAGGTAQNYTVTSPYNNQYLWLSYNSSLSCRDSVKVILTTNGPVNFTLSPLSSTLCQGSSITASVILTGQPALYNCAWSPLTFLSSTSPNQQTMTINPFSTIGTTNSIVYTVVVTPTAGTCPASKTLAVIYINPPQPTIGVIPAFCRNSPPFTVTASPSGGVFSGPFPVFGNGIIVPSSGSAGLYTFSYSSLIGNCTSTAFGSFLINPLPTLSIAGTTMICIGNTTTLVANGANTYTWSTNGTNPAMVISPTVTTSFSVAGTNTLTNCVNTKTAQVTVNPLPLLLLFGNTTVCKGQAVTLTAMGANSYTWSTNATGSVVVASPMMSTNYSVTGTNTLTGCLNTKSVPVTVNPLPVLSIAGNTSICEGETTTIIISGATGGYEWSNGSITNSIVVSPGGTTAYSVVGTSVLQCESSMTVTILVSECTGLNEMTVAEELIRIYPNPTSGILFIELKTTTFLTLCNQDGAVLFEGVMEGGKHLISLTDYAAGIYMLQCVGNKTSQRTFRIVVLP